MSDFNPAVAQPSSKAPVVVDPRIAAIIKDPSAPRGLVPRTAVPASVPGTSGAWAALSVLYGMMRYGVSYSERVRLRFGDIYRSMQGPEPLVFVSDPDEVAKIARNEDCAWSTAMGWDTLVWGIVPASESGASLLQLDFDAHRRARKSVQPAFTTKAVKGYIEIAQRGISAAIPGWIARGSVAFKAEARALLARIANAIFTGLDDPAQIARVDRSLLDAWNGVQVLIRDARISPKFRRARRGYDDLFELFMGVIPARRADPGADLLSQLCQVEDKEGLGDEAMVRIFVGLMFAAYDTTALAVTSMAYLLAKHPAWQERVRQEALALDALEWADLQKLEQLEWVWKETLRLMPVTGYLPRRALRDVELLGHRLEAGTFVAAATGALGRSARWWQNPLAFDPERFSPERAEDKSHPGIYMPFGGGAHACIGMQLAGIEAKLLFHNLLSHCRFELAPYYEAEHTFAPLGCVSGKVSLKLSPL